MALHCIQSVHIVGQKHNYSELVFNEHLWDKAKMTVKQLPVYLKLVDLDCQF